MRTADPEAASRPLAVCILYLAAFAGGGAAMAASGRGGSGASGYAAAVCSAAVLSGLLWGVGMLAGGSSRNGAVLCAMYTGVIAAALAGAFLSRPRKRRAKRRR